MTPDEAPPIGGMAANLIFLAMLVVMLVVPWIMAGATRSRGTERESGLEDRAESCFSSDRERRRECAG